MVTELLLSLIGYSVVVVIQTCLLMRQINKTQLDQANRGVLMVHLAAALVIPFAFVMISVLVRAGIVFIFVSSLVGVWCALYSVARLLVDELRKQQTS